VPGSAAIVTDTLEQLTPRAATAESVGKVFAAASKRLRGLVPHDASVWLATDPATGMPTAPARSEQLGAICTGDAGSCLRVWELEFTVHDVNLYRDLARSTTPAGALRLATRDRPARSPRYREFLQTNGFGDELRAVMRVNGAAWASIGLFREHGRPAFSAHETALLAGLSEPLAAAVRAHAQPATETAATGEDRGPGLMVFDRDGELISANDEALAWLEELPPDTGDPGSFSVRLPMVVVGALMRARAIADEHDHGPARARLRSPSTGCWLVCHASCLRNADGTVGNTALVIEPAKSSELAPIIAQAYQLSTREQQITH